MSAKRALSRGKLYRSDSPADSYKIADDTAARSRLSEAQARKKELQQEFHELQARIQYMEKVEARTAARTQASERLLQAFENKRQAQEDRKRDLALADELATMESELQKQAHSQEKQRRGLVRQQLEGMLMGRRKDVQQFKEKSQDLQTWRQHFNQEHLSYHQQTVHQIREARKQRKEREEKNTEMLAKTVRQERQERRAIIDAARERGLQEKIQRAKEVKDGKRGADAVNQMQTTVKASVNADIAAKLDKEEREIRRYLQETERIREEQARTRSAADSKRLKLRSLVTDFGVADPIQNRFRPLN